MTRPINIDSIETATGKSWEQWLQFFEGINAKDLPHSEIAEAVAKTGTPGWWAQNVTVAYEQHIGRRLPGQRDDGSFEVSVSKTITGSPDDAMKWWLDRVTNMDNFGDVPFAGTPARSTTDKWRHWRVNLADGSKVTVSTTQKDTNKSLLAVISQKLSTAQEIDSWRSYWKQFLAKD